MNRLRLILAGATFYRRSHLAVAIGAAAATAVLVGALAVGDSVRHSLRRAAMARIGAADVALVGGDRLFRAALADELAEALNARAAPVLLVRGAASKPDQSVRRNDVQVIGVDGRFAELAPAPTVTADNLPGVVLNDRLARELKVTAGEQIVLRFEKLSTLSREAPLARDVDATIAARLTVGAVVGDEQFGRFSLRATHTKPPNAFVPLDWLARQLERPDRANLLLVGRADGGRLTPDPAQQALEQHWRLADAGLTLERLTDRRAMELRTDRLFLAPPIADAVDRAFGRTTPVLTYFAKELRVADRATPYSFVAAINDPALHTDELDDAGIVINAWLADDLGAAVGDELSMRYWVMGPGRTLAERTAAFTIRHVLPMGGPAIDRALMPDFPGLADVENCGQWEAGVPIDFASIRDKDEQYWDDYRGTPKAFVNLATGQRLWGNRFGELTAIRFDPGRQTVDDAAAALRGELDPRAVGLTWVDVRRAAARSAEQALGFGGLFIGFSFFLIVAALVLTGLLFAFAIEQRVRQVGLLRAVGFGRGGTLRLFLAEGAAVAVVGTLIGAAAGLGYTGAVLWALVTLWRGAVNTTSLHFHVTGATLTGGAAGALAAALATMAWVLRRQTKRPARELLAGVGESPARRPGAGRGSAAWMVVCFAGAIAIVAWSTLRHTSQAAAFFAGGTLVLVGAFAGARWMLGRMNRRSHAPLRRIGQLALHGMARRPGRSLATVMMMATGVFLVIAIGANRHDVTRHADRRDSGTGGFALYAESTMPVLGDLNTTRGRQTYALGDEQFEGASVVNLRLREGDDASCFNLARAQRPRLLGVRPEALAKRGAFTFTRAIDEATLERGWKMLDDAGGNDVVPAIGDEATVVWGLGLDVGDAIAYTDARGETFEVKIVGVIANSIFQGGLLIDRAAFDRRFANTAGYRVMLIDAPDNRAARLSQRLSRALSAEGLAVMPAARRLASFAAVENTYLAIFQALGALGVVLGSAGLGVVVGRNVIEREGELALLRAVGFTRRAVGRMVLGEHLSLGAAGIAIGTIAALLAVYPATSSPGSNTSYAAIAWSIGLIVASAAMWTIIAVRLALRRPMIGALRNE